MKSLSRVLVAGGAGFIGSHVVDSLVSNGFTVRADVTYYKSGLGDVRASFADMSKAEKQLGYESMLPLEKGLRSLVGEVC